MKVSEAMVRCLEEEKITVLFGYPGAAICPFYEALALSPIRHILVRTEQNAGHAASGYARMSGKCGVCVATSGPGATNLISGIASAYMDSIPLVVITGQVDSHLLGRDVFQEVDTTGMVEPFIKHSYLLKNPADTCRVFKEAFYLAQSGRPGPVLIDVPVDVQQRETRFAYPERAAIRSYKPSSMGHIGQIRRAAEAIRHADRPLLVAGGGVFASGAGAVLKTFLEKTGMPAVHTMMGIGALPFEYPLRLGMIGVFGAEAANLALNRADLLVLAGTRVGDRSIPAPELLARDKKVIHIDIDPAEIGKNIPADIPVVGDLRLILEQLCGELEGPELNPLTDWKREALHYKETVLLELPSRDRPDPRAVLKALCSRMEPGGVLSADVGQNQIWAADSFEVPGGRFLTSGGMGTMGCAVPTALGARVACPDRQVVAVCGDGSFQMSMMELATMRQHNVAVKLVVFRNNRLGMVAEFQREHGKETAVCLDGSPDFVRLADAYGIPARRLSRPEEIPVALDAMFRTEGTFLLEVETDPEEPTLPPLSGAF